ncbi:MAG: hypothetical protein AAF497_20275 [Planctomycetota bacterium]
MSRLSLVLILFVSILPGLLNAQPVETESKPANVATQEPAFAGKWRTTYGVMSLTVSDNQASGTYGLGTVTGTIEGSEFKFSYTEPNAAGEGVFTLSENGKSFTGKWKDNRGSRWLPWTGERIVVQPLGFAGLWQSTYGPMRLGKTNDDISGNYLFNGQEGQLSGQLKGKRFIFRYVDKETEGAGWFELSDDKQRLNGKWRTDGDATWRNWKATRTVAQPNRIWLMILEADWETSLGESEYAFADMLESYFKMPSAKHLDVRKRSFHDQKDLVKFCRRVKYLPGPVVLLISTHGTAKGITVGGETIGPKALARSLQGTDNLRLLHLSGCSMMSSNFPELVYNELPAAKFPISGYKTSVAWDASAIGDFTYLSMLLIHGLEPSEAVEQAIRLSPYLGDQRIPGAKYQALGLAIRNAPKHLGLVKKSSVEESR